MDMRLTTYLTTYISGEICGSPLISPLISSYKSIKMILKCLSWYQGSWEGGRQEDSGDEVGLELDKLDK